PPRRIAALLALAHRHVARAPGQPLDALPRHVPRAFLGYHERQLLHPGTHVLRDGNGRRPHPFLGRLSVRSEPAGHEMDGYRSARPRGPRENPERQRQAAAATLTTRNL